MNQILKFSFAVTLTCQCLSGICQTDSSRFKMVEALSKYIKYNYVSRELAIQMSDSISWKLNNNKYDPSLNLDEFVFEITQDLRRISRDQHISVNLPVELKLRKGSHVKFMDTTKVDRMTDRQRDKFFSKWRRRTNKFQDKFDKRTNNDMFTYGDIKILPGNIGYVEIKHFQTTSWYKKDNRGRIAIKDVMKFLSNTNSIIIDFRENRGGYAKQAELFCSYFSARTNNYFLTTEFHHRRDSSGVLKEVIDTFKKFTNNKIDNAFTHSKSIYILTSQRTFSAGEITAYKIKQFNPSTLIIGEKTDGGGNSYSSERYDKYFTAIIPNLLSYDEENNNYNLEAKGVLPDSSIQADSAFTLAYKLALKGTSPSGLRIKYFKKQKNLTNNKKNPIEENYKDYVGNYRKIQVIYKDNKLFMVYDHHVQTQLFPKGIDNFTDDDKDQVSFYRAGNGGVTEIEINYPDGSKEVFRRIN